MKGKLGLETAQKQQQTLTMTVEMKNALAMLQMPLLELRQMTGRLIEENPMLAYEETWERENSGLSGWDPPSTDDEEAEDFETPAPAPTFLRHLLSQLGELTLTQQQHQICSYLVQSLDERGYFTEDLQSVCLALGRTMGEVQCCLDILRGLSPTGVGAKDLQDCLLMQIPQAEHSLARQILEKHLSLLSENKLTKIARLCGVTPAQVAEAVDYLRSLQPIPSAGFPDGSRRRYILPEGSISLQEGALTLRLNESLTPHLCISAAYAEIYRTTDDEGAKQYLHQKRMQAMAAVKGIYSRTDTLRQVLEALMELQADYFLFGTARLHPMTQKQLAEKLQLHESTISRAIYEKYIDCPQGTVALKSLFSTSLGESEGDSAAAVKSALTACIQQEDKTHPLSDDAVGALLQQQGHVISRRTVAKYRTQLNIPPASQRKTFH